jgi:hypothetical protein
MVLVAGTGALHKGHRFGSLAAAGLENLAAGGAAWRGQALHHHVADQVGAVIEVIGFQLGGVVGGPAGGPNHGRSLDGDLLTLVVQIHRAIGTGLGGLLALPVPAMEGSITYWKGYAI